MSGKRTDSVVFALVAVLVTALLAGAVAARRGGGPPTPVPLRTIRIAGESDYFTFPDVVRELERNNFRVKQTHKGTVGIADLPDLATSYDVANAGSQNAADHIATTLKDKHHVTPSQTSPFSSPMVIITYQRIVPLLQKLGIARKNDNGPWVFEVSAYLDTVRQKKRWSDIPDNRDYSSTNQVLVSITDPNQSNSGGMLMAIETYVANGTGSPVDDVAAFQKGQPDWAKTIRCTFACLGAKVPDTTDLVSLFARDGINRFPMVMIYENNYINAKLYDPAKLGQTVLMYPNPTVTADNTFVSLNKDGKDFTDLFDTDKTLIDLAENHGYRARGNTPQFAKHITENEVIADLGDPKTGFTVASPPTEQNLTQLIAELGK